MTLRTPLGELELRSAIRARPDERLAAATRRLEHRRLLRTARRRANLQALRLQRELRLNRVDLGAGGEQLLLHSLLHLHPLFEREADRVRHGHDLVRSESD